MANQEQLAILEKGVETWNKWRDENPEAGIDLKEAQLRHVNLANAHLKDARLDGAMLWEANLNGADLRNACLNNADLWGAHLEGAVLREARLDGTVLWEAHLEGAVFRGAYLEGADLRNAAMDGSDFWEAHLERANLRETKMQKVELTKAKLNEALLLDANFTNNNTIGNADWGHQCGEEAKGYDGDAESIYRTLQKIFETQGIGSLVGEFAYKKNRARQKSEWKRDKNPFKWFWFWLLDILCGYGEKPERSILWLLIITIAPGFIYFFGNGLGAGETLWECIYFSLVSTTTIGYGGWVMEPTEWALWLGGFQSFIGIFLMTLFVSTFTRWITR
jgi:hypothetical protein